MTFAPNHALRMYAQVGVETGVAAASPRKLIVMLYDGAIGAITKAETAMRAGRIADKGQAISKAIQIIEEGLVPSLDLNNGGQIAAQLQQLYQYMGRRLLLASLRNDPTGLVEVAKLLLDLKSAWEAIPDNPAPEATQQSSAGRASAPSSVVFSKA